MASYNYTKATVRLSQLEQEIRDNITITVAPTNSRYEGDINSLTIHFPSALTSAEETELGIVVSNHIAIYPPKVQKFKADILMENIGDGICF